MRLRWLLERPLLAVGGSNYRTGCTACRLLHIYHGSSEADSLTDGVAEALENATAAANSSTRPSFAVFFAENHDGTKAPVLPVPAVPFPLLGSVLKTDLADRKKVSCDLVCLGDGDSEGESGAAISTFLAASDSLPSFDLAHDDLSAMVTKERPTFLTLAPRSFDVGALAKRLGVLFQDSHQIAATADGRFFVQPPSPSTSTAEEGATSPPTTTELQSEAAVGLLLRNPGCEAALVPDATERTRLARSVLRLIFREGFILDRETESALFVPQGFLLDRSQEQQQQQPLRTGAQVRIPIFPLSVFMFPGVSMPLRIFEPRYRCLVKHSLEKGEPFGLIHPESRVGCMVWVSSLENMAPDGCSSIIVTGLELFRVPEGITPSADSHNFGLNFVEVEPLEFAVDISDEDKEEAETIRDTLLAKIPHPTLRETENPAQFAFQLGFWLSTVDAIPLAMKISLTETTSVIELMRKLVEVLETRLSGK